MCYTVNMISFLNSCGCLNSKVVNSRYLEVNKIESNNVFKVGLVRNPSIIRIMPWMECSSHKRLVQNPELDPFLPFPGTPGNPSSTHAPPLPSTAVSRMAFHKSHSVKQLNIQNYEPNKNVFLSYLPWKKKAGNTQSCKSKIVFIYWFLSHEDVNYQGRTNSLRLRKVFL